MSSLDPLFSVDAAEVFARKHLETLGLASEIAHRTVSVSDEGECYRVVFAPPPGIRAGAFTITIGKDGTILDQKFER